MDLLPLKQSHMQRCAAGVPLCQMSECIHCSIFIYPSPSYQSSGFHGFWKTSHPVHAHRMTYIAILLREVLDEATAVLLLSVLNGDLVLNAVHG